MNNIGGTTIIYDAKMHLSNEGTSGTLSPTHKVLGSISSMGSQLGTVAGTATVNLQTKEIYGKREFHVEGNANPMFGNLGFRFTYKQEQGTLIKG
ncbi:MAG TPA: hypothetical protein VND99_04080 [Candidatus Acidoferrales bacterium]|nr:hypothetical protein [Candidatus Acidoferrales bacterium]